MIDWFTVVAQLVNFLVLVLLLKYFLYGRIMAAIDRREQEIARRQDEAERQRREAAQELATARDTNRRLEEEREQHLMQVREEVEQHRQQLVAQVRADADDLQSRWAKAIQDEMNSFLRDLRYRVSEEACAIARRVLTDLANADLEQQMVTYFLQAVEQMNDDELQSMTTRLPDGMRLATVQTTRELRQDLRDAVVDVLQGRCDGDLHVQFEQSQDLLCGISLRSVSHKLAWDVSDYVASLERDLRKALEEEASAKSSPPPEAINQ